MKIDPFILLLLALVAMAWAAPEVGVAGSRVNPSEVASWGVVGVFFFYGLKLSPQQWRAGLSNFRLHALVQLSTFLLFPLLILLVMPHHSPSMVWVGVFFVAALPSTVSSSVVMVSMARGNVAAAIFNASLSSLLGVVLTPLWMSLFISADMGGAPIGSVVVKLCLQVLLPVAAGMFCNRYWGLWAQGHGHALRIFDQAVILSIVYTSFCEGFFSGVFGSVSWTTLLLLGAGMVALFFTVYLIIGGLCRWLHLSQKETTTALFCGSKKSLVHGTVMSKIIVQDAATVSLLLLPIMIYHALQLLIVSFLATRRAKNSTIA
ncbi:MAG: bile acid:sodium symporter family protein [Mucinivorans sp.]